MNPFCFPLVTLVLMLPASVSVNVRAALPTSATHTATAVGSPTATLNGTVNANSASTTVTFEYGVDTSYGTTVSGVPRPVTGSTDTPVSYSLVGLSNSIAYHYRVVAKNVNGTAYGVDTTFRTHVAVPALNTPGLLLLAFCLVGISVWKLETSHTRRSWRSATS